MAAQSKPAAGQPFDGSGRARASVFRFRPYLRSRAQIRQREQVAA